MAIGIEKFKLINGKWTIDKDPNSYLDYFYKLTDWLRPGEVITDVEFFPGGGVIVDNLRSGHTSDIITVWLSEGTPSRKPQTAWCTARFTTNQGRIDDRTLWFNMVQK